MKVTSATGSTGALLQASTTLNVNAKAKSAKC